MSQITCYHNLRYFYSHNLTLCHQTSLVEHGPLFVWENCQIFFHLSNIWQKKSWAVRLRWGEMRVSGGLTPLIHANCVAFTSLINLSWRQSTTEKGFSWMSSVWRKCVWLLWQNVEREWGEWCLGETISYDSQTRITRLWYSAHTSIFSVLLIPLPSSSVPLNARFSLGNSIPTLQHTAYFRFRLIIREFKCRDHTIAASDLMG